MKRAITAVVAFAVITFGGVVLLTLHGAGQPIPVAKFPAVPDEQDLNNIRPDPDSDGKIHVCVVRNGEQIGMTAIDGDDFAPGAAPVWAKQAAIAKAQSDIIGAYNETASLPGDGDGMASAAYVKYCWDCGGGPGCCGWTCNGKFMTSGDTQVCVPYRSGNCVKAFYDCPSQGHVMNCGFCDYIDPP